MPYIDRGIFILRINALTIIGAIGPNLDLSVFLEGSDVDQYHIRSENEYVKTFDMYFILKIALCIIIKINHLKHLCKSISKY